MAPVDRAIRLIVGLSAVFALFQWVAFTFGSDRGQAGLLVGAVVVVATVVADSVLFGGSPARAARLLGLGVPARRGLLAALGVGVLLVLVIPDTAP